MTEPASSTCSPSSTAGCVDGDPGLGALQVWLIGFAAVMFLPIPISIGFSLWAATRPSLPAAHEFAALRLWRQHEPGRSCENMRRGARALGVAELANHRFIITADGYASVEPSRAQTVHGVLWRITPRDRVLLDTWENVGGGLYRAETLPVRGAEGRMAALVYFARPGPEGRAKPATSSLWSPPPGNGICRHPISARCKPGWRRARSGRTRARSGNSGDADPPRGFRGRVQGVGFRAVVEDQAARTGVQGWVRNRRDGTVEAVFAGDLQPSRTLSRLAARALTPPVSTVSGHATAAPRNSRCAATKTDLRCCKPCRRVSGSRGRPEQRLELAPHHHVDPGHADRQARSTRLSHRSAGPIRRTARCRKNATDPARRSRRCRAASPTCARGCRWRRSCPRSHRLFQDAAPRRRCGRRAARRHIECSKRPNDPLLQAADEHAHVGVRRLRSSIT